MSLFYSYWMSLNHVATRKSFGKFVSQSAMNGCAVIELTWTDKVRKLLLTYWLHASTSSFLLWQWRPNFLNGFPVIFISDSTMLMQEIVISFEEVTQTKLTVKLRISQSSTQSLNIVRDLLFKQRFSSLTLDLSRGFVVFETYFKCFTFKYITNYAFRG